VKSGEYKDDIEKEEHTSRKAVPKKNSDPGWEGSPKGHQLMGEREGEWMQE